MSLHHVVRRSVSFGAAVCLDAVCSAPPPGFAGVRGLGNSICIRFTSCQYFVAARSRIPQTPPFRRPSRCANPPRVRVARREAASGQALVAAVSFQIARPASTSANILFPRCRRQSPSRLAASGQGARRGIACCRSAAAYRAIMSCVTQVCVAKGHCAINAGFEEAGIQSKRHRMCRGVAELPGLFDIVGRSCKRPSHWSSAEG